MPLTNGAMDQPLRALPDGLLLALAPAKLNLTLRVGPPRADGYHPLDSVVAKVTLWDELTFQLAGPGELRLTCSGLAVEGGEGNLVLRAARALQKLAPACGAAITLTKRIPLAAGLGGGSSDAAATLLALNRLWELDLPGGELLRLAATLGSDVPLFLGPPASRMTGRGEVLEPVAIRPFAAVLVTPPLACPTGDVYRAYDALGPHAMEPTDLSFLRDLPASQWAPMLGNDLFAPACRVCPEVGQWAQRLAQCTGLSAHLTGSGSALFVLADDADCARAMMGRLSSELRSAGQVVAANTW